MALPVIGGSDGAWGTTLSNFLGGAAGDGTPTIPNNRIPYLAGGNHTSSANLTFDGTTLTVNTLTVSTGALTVTGVGPHVIGGTALSTHQFRLAGDFSGGAGLVVISTLTPGLDANAYGILCTPTLVEHSSGTHPEMVGLQIALAITAGAAATTHAAAIDIPTFVAPSGTVNATGIRISGPSGATNNRAINIESGDIFKGGSAYTNPAYVFEHWATGQIVRFADRDGASEYHGLRPLGDVEQFSRQNYELPIMTLKPEGGLFDRGDLLLASVEESYLYLFDHEKRLAQLERTLEGTAN